MERYGGLDDSSCSSYSDDDADDTDGGHEIAPPTPSGAGDVVLHLDVDAFYCQCEELRNPDLATRPFAIGQKHIIVTCNYSARAEGVRKLMLRTEAKKACPELAILEGSDLEPYRRDSRRVYSSFRAAVASLPGGAANSAKKGGMDEMYADISKAVSLQQDRSCRGKDDFGMDGDNVFVYGEGASTRVSIVEDQSGATTHFSASSTPTRLQRNGHWDIDATRDICTKRLAIAAKFACDIQRKVKVESGFKACVGVSVSPMLAKLASELRKPNSINMLYPWRAREIISGMPLRKIPGLGSNTFRSLEASLKEHNAPATSHWTCSDLLRVPRRAVAAACGDEQCDLLLQRCQGIDPVRIVDDNGGLAKTVSVEDSFKRGSLVTMPGVFDAMEELYRRLPRLLDDRQRDCELPEMSYPSTIRVTVRLVDKSISGKRRPFVTRSKQSSFDGRSMLSHDTGKDRCDLLRAATRPLLDQLLPSSLVTLDVTRLNVAVTDFADLGVQGSPSEPKQPSVKQFLLGGKRPAESTLGTKQSTCTEQKKSQSAKKRKSTLTLDALFKAQRSHQKQAKSPPNSERACRRDDAIDPSFLAALPADIRAEVERDVHHQIEGTVGRNRNKSSKKKVDIKSFFSSK